MPEYLEHPLIKEKALQAREYQQSILETALKKNVLCVLPTGLGKTNVAVLLAAHRLGELPESRILVLAPTRPLVNQHYESFSRFLKIGQEELQVVTGAVKPAERKALYQEKRIIFATPQCVTGDTTIFTPNQGIVKIKNFVENHKLKKCNYGSKIGFCGNSDKFTIGLENGVISSVEVKKVWKLPANILYKIDTELKNSITCTPEHPLLTIEPDGPIKWKEARHIKEGVWIAMPRKIALPEQELDLYKLLEKEKTNLRLADRSASRQLLDVHKQKDFKRGKISAHYYTTLPLMKYFQLARLCKVTLPNYISVTNKTGRSKPIRIPRVLTSDICYLIGAIFGDGHIGQRKGKGNEVIFSAVNEADILKKFKDIAFKSFGILPKTDRQKGLVYNSTALAQLFGALGVPFGKKAWKLHVPHYIFTLPATHVWAFLAGLFDTDGHAAKHSVSIASISKGLITELKWLLLKVGITSSIYKKERNNFIFRGKPCKGKPIFSVHFSGEEQIRNFIALARPARSKCAKILKSLSSARRPGTRSKDTLPVPEALKIAYRQHRANGGNSNNDVVIAYHQKELSIPFLSRLLPSIRSQKAREIEQMLALPIRWVKVRSVKQVRRKTWVYDLTIEGCHNFIGNYLVNHNTIQNDLKSRRISLEGFSLLVLDEIHHAIGRYAYPFVSKAYQKQAGHPRILGLTASPGGTTQKIKEICKNCGIEAVEVRAQQDQDVAPYVHEKQVEWLNLDLPASFLEVRQLLNKAYKKRIDALKAQGFIRGTRVTKKQLLELQARLFKAIKTGHKKAFSGIRYTTQAIKIEHATGLLETQGISALERYWAKLRADKKAGPILRDPDISQAMARSRALAEAGCKHPKMSAICSVVDRTLAENPQARIIIFASYRDTVKEIVGVLSSLEQARPIILMGQRDGLSQKEQIEVIKRFGEGDCNILVTTSIGEEGLSIESADIAVFYEAVPSEIRQIQRRGRVGRVRIGKIIILITKNTRDEAYYWAARQKERRMHKTLKGMANQEALQNP